MSRLTRKITTRVSNLLNEKLKKRLKEACLQRDLYLDRILKHETRMLDLEVEKPNSKEAKQFIKHNLQRLDTTPVSLVLSEETISAMDDVCRRKSIPRDAFINRVILFLLLKREHFDKLLDIDIKLWITDQLLSDYGSELAFEATAVGLSGISQSITSDPFWAIRRCIEYQNQEYSGSCDLLHAAFIDENFMEKGNARISLVGLNCFVANFRIEGTQENEAWIHMFDEFLEPGDNAQNNKH